MKTSDLFIVVASAGILSFYGCSKSVGENVPVSGSPNSAQMEALAGCGNCGNTVAQIQMEDLSDGEIQALQFMREEEKLARDVYLTLYDQWGLMVFINISKSEQAHMDAVLNLLLRYGLEDPSEGKDIGVFADKYLQDLYDQLIARGTESALEALKVGALIEEVDIVDIQRLLDEEVDNEDIRFVFSNLKRGSTFHLKAFVRNLKRFDIDYVPEVLDVDIYDEIMQ